MNKAKLCVGITGNIGSGKSTVAECFKRLGAGVVSADHIARALTLPNRPAYNDIVAHFGTEILNEDKTLNRAHLRQKITADAHERKWLEGLLHPLIRSGIENEVLLQTTPYVVIEIPLLVTKDDYPYLSRVLVVVSDEGKQIARTMLRDNVSEEEAQRLLNAQPSVASRLAIADDIIHNHHDINDLIRQVESLHHYYLTLI